ncbi:phytosulfokine receptor 1-like [Triticum dicoccoides]|uniref:phytosulfokine receptor 1-like n=1 Tax=Triticum dicoccoides TaxID=85692 RepID=UPI000E791FE2|nr:phytosulfokine receptor 1-like [Triticum dicoccoides]
MGARCGLLGFLLVAAVLLRVRGAHALNQTCDADDLEALRAFSDGLDGKGAGAGLAGWGAGDGGSCCSWTGVSCDLGRVVGLDLSNRSLRGVISPSVASLGRLAALNLSRNSFRGQAPAGLGLLPGLRALDLSANALSGAFPSGGGGASGFTAIEVVNVSFNEFAGPHPAFPGAANLTVLDISGNRFSGSINTTALCGAAQNLTVLRFSGNAFSGDVPAGFGRCEALSELSLDGNGLAGSLPGDLYTMPELQRLSLQDNNLSGDLDNLGNLSQLVQIDLSYNKFTGFIPDVFGRLRKLESLNLATNGFNGTLPGSLSSCPALTVVSVRNNSLSGEITLNFSRLPRLNTFDAGSNRLSGNIPASLARCAELKTLNLARNKLDGEIPESFKNLSSLLYLSLTGNGFTNLSSALQVLQDLPKLTSLVLTNNFHGGETMPMDGIKGFTSMEVLVLANCALTGTIPPWLQTLENLSVLDISWNKLHGNIPRWLGSLNNLFYIDLSNNSFTGELPESFTQMKGLISSDGSSERASTEYVPLFIKKNSTGKGLQYNQVSSFPASLILSNNLLTGPVLPGFGHLVKLLVLDLNWNNFSGRIPDELSGMSSLEKLKLAHNDLSGSIPSSLTKLNFLSEFDVSYNNLTGDIPTGGQFSTFANEGFVGNSALCLLRNASCSKKARLVEAAHRKKSKASLAAVGVGTAVGVIFVLWITYVILARVVRSRMHERNPKAVANAEDSSGSANSSLVLLFQNNKDLSIEDILKSTNHFDQAYIVGCGGFGLVYKSTLPDGRKVAIKRLSGDYSQIEREFQAEVETLSRAQHENLVLLQGYCKIGNDRLLIYSYMENGSLDYWLHERTDSGALLDWQKRLRIAQGSARGLAYLHMSCEPRILHRDIKSSNILLDENFEAHLADFGLARLVCAYDTHVTTDVVGTLGYIPPEYAQSPIATYKGDIYSFGIVLLELLTGRRPVDMCRPKGSRDVVSWVLQMRKEDRETEVFHPNVHDKANEGELLRVLEIACLCVTAAPKSRPTSQQLVTWLDDIAENRSLIIQ